VGGTTRRQGGQGAAVGGRCVASPAAVSTAVAAGHDARGWHAQHKTGEERGGARW
jgi:hypothetical protein